MAKRDQLPRLIALLRDQRWAALATTGDEGSAEASMVAYVPDEKLDAVYLHLSQLAAHSRNLQHHPESSMAISEVDTGEGDPQQLARVTLYGHVTLLQRSDPDYDRAKRLYLQRLPTAEPLFNFSDFNLYRLSISKAHFVGGFAQAHSYDAADLGKASSKSSQG